MSADLLYFVQGATHIPGRANESTCMFVYDMTERHFLFGGGQNKSFCPHLSRVRKVLSEKMNIKAELVLPEIP